MVAKKGSRGEDAEEELTRVPLQAIILADSFATLFRPITLERPKVLLPLVNAPMIEYTLAWLESAGVEEVFVFCCAHSKQVTDYLRNSNWLNHPKFSVTTIESYNAMSAGDALRVIYERNVIHGDFILVTGDTVSNMPLNHVLKEHKERRKNDRNAVMTMVIKQSKPSPITHQSRLGTEELFMAIDPETKELLYYEDKADASKGTVSLDKTMLFDRSSISLHNDKQDCFIDICSPEVLSLFTDNFDYQQLRRHFVKGLLVDDIMGYKIFTHEIHSSYAARVDNYRSYDTVSKDIIQRWTYPLVPDVPFLQNSLTKLERQGTYWASDIGFSHSAKIGPFTVIGRGTTVGNHSEVSNSVIGEGCIIGSNVSIDGCYIWNKVTIEDGCKLKHAIVCDGVIMKSGAVLEAGVVLSFKSLLDKFYNQHIGCTRTSCGEDKSVLTLFPDKVKSFQRDPNCIGPESRSLSIGTHNFKAWICCLYPLAVENSNADSYRVTKLLYSTSEEVVIGQNFVVPAYSKVSLQQQPVKQDSDEELEYADNSSGNIEIAFPNTAEMLEESRTEVADSQIQAASEVGGVGFIWSIGEKGLEEEWRHSVAPIPADRLIDIIKTAADELEISNADSNILPPSGELERDSVNDSDEDARDDTAHFEKEVEATFLRAVHENVKEDHVILEVNSLRLSYNLASTDCAGALFYAMMKLALDTPHGSPGELLKNVAGVIGKWKKVLKYYLPSIDEEIEVILKFEEMCLESTKEYSPLFAKILHLLYDKDILQEDAILNWAAEKEEADESDKLFLKQAEVFIQWLNEASEEEE